MFENGLLKQEDLIDIITKNRTSSKSEELAGVIIHFDCDNEDDSEVD